MQEQIHKLPKVELHSHLEGTIKPELAKQIAKRNAEPLDNNLFDDNGGYAWSDFASFLTAYDSVSSCLKNGEDYRDITYEYLKDCANENVIYAETFISPDHAAECGISYDDMISGIASGVDDAERDFGIVGRIIVTCVRHLGPEQGLNVVQTMVDNPHPYVVGFGMGGDENAFTIEEYAPAYNIAANAGYACTVHAGEICGPDSVWDAINYLPISRIGHGVKSVYDEKLISELINRKIHLEICPGSNLALSLFPNWESHPLLIIMKKGISISLNSDDPPFFNTTVGQEYQNSAKNLNLNIEDLKQISLMAMEASFADIKIKSRLIEEIKKF
ncbi:MAG: adenosine deaminase [Pseudomonadota bacterium]|nr:adenosine deaminase [Pseudomonadota bacterium]